MKTVLPADVDKECVALCKAINELPGVYTTSSCCGHGIHEEPYRIFFEVDGLAALPNVLYWFFEWNSGLADWRIIPMCDDGKGAVYFLIEGPVGERAYKESKLLAKLIKRNADHVGHHINARLDPTTPDGSGYLDKAHAV
jgi:hypothetical protein